MSEKILFTCKAHFTKTLEVKQSKFIAHLVPYNQFSELLDSLRLEHPKARHFVTAFRYINEYEQIVEGCSDDGEPKGTSGKPSLHVIQGNELINIAVVIVRYFGGTKLGTGGLVRAYSEAVNNVIHISHLSTYLKLEKLEFLSTYDKLGLVEYTLSKFGVTIVSKDFLALDIVICVEGTKEQLNNIINALDRKIVLNKA